MSDGDSHSPEKEPDLRTLSWMQWLDRCALSRCDAECKAYLEDVLYKRAKSNLRKIEGGDNFIRVELLEDFRQVISRDPASLSQTFENWLRFTKKEVSGRCVKFYLQQKASAGGVSQLEASVTLIQLDYFREEVRKEGVKSAVSSKYASIDAPTESNEGSEQNRTSLESRLRSDQLLPVAEDLLATLSPAPGQEAELNELEQMAEKFASEFYTQLEHDQRLVLAANQLGMAITSQEILEKAKRGKSQLYDSQKKALNALHQSVSERFGTELEEDGQLQRYFILRVLKQLQTEAVGNFFPEKHES